MNEQNFSQALQLVAALADDFRAHEKTYLEAKYQEAEVRLAFIDKFWAALGWDVYQQRHKNPYEQEVKVERGVTVSERRKRADYAFFAAPNYRDVKFYVEAKKPARNIDNADDYFQTIRYGWSSNTPLAVLTDFEQFRIIDCRYKPNIKTALNFAVKSFDYADYADEAKFSEIYYLFSREAVLAGSLEKFVAGQMPQRGGRGGRQGKLFATGIQQAVDESFLAELDVYRESLARAFKTPHPELTSEDLTEAVARSLDRLVFIRFLEDKLIEQETLIDKFSSWADFVRASARLDGFYNGVIFKKNEILDSGKYEPEETVFLDICAELSAQDSPYNFNTVPIHILGSIYERFLGKTIVAGESGASVVEKPEVRKAGGVYYTPEYIVRYITENTVGKLIAGKTPAEIREMRFADIACGSGSFLLGVYDLLLRYHTGYYNEKFKAKSRGDERQREARRDGCIERADGTFQLSIAQRREILRNNVYGVDIDAQAVEVAQFSLFLKLLEDATTATARAYQPKLGEKLLPDMTQNIVCGNSLVDWDILDGTLFERHEERKLNPMSYEAVFPEVIRRGGFDAIVGNPPWGAEFSKSSISYLQKRYANAQTATKDSYSLFIEKGFNVLRVKGLLGYITPDTFLRKDDYFSLRNFLLNNSSIKELIETGPVFSQVRDTWCLVFTTENQTPNGENKILHKKISRFIVSAEERLEKFGSSSWDDESFINQNYWRNSPNMIVAYLAHENKQQLISKIEKQLRLYQQKDKFRISRGEEGSKFNIQTSPSGEFYLVIPADVSRYQISTGVRVEKSTLTRNKISSYYEHPKIWITRIQKMRWKQRLVCAFDERINSAGMKTLQVIVSSNDNENDLRYLLGILSSTLINFYCLNYLADDLNQSYLEKLPIRTINFENPSEKAMHDKMCGLVEAMLASKKQLAEARTDKDRVFCENKCAALDRQIDALVFQLYDLSPEEIALVENAS